MASFQYEALRLADKFRSSGVIEASTERAAREKLREQELVPTSLSQVQTSGIVVGLKDHWGLRLFKSVMGVSLREKAAFSRNLSMMLKSGIPLLDALANIERYSENTAMAAVIRAVHRDILGGLSFSQALAKHERLFDSLYVSVVEAGEVSAELPAALERLTSLLLKSYQLQMKLLTTLLYPAVVLIIAVIVMAMMLFFVLPMFEDIYARMEVVLPWITEGLLVVSHSLRDYYWVLALLVLACVAGIVLYRRTTAGKALWDYYLIRLPVLGELVELMNHAQFISTLGVSYGAGVPISESLVLATKTVTHTQLRLQIAKVNQSVQSGKLLVPALAETSQLPDIVMLMLATGEVSGQLDEMLQAAYEYLEEELNYRIDMLMSLLEPFLLLLLGGIVALLALATYLPMFQLYNSL